MDPLHDIQDQTLEVLRRHLTRGDRIALIDFPSHQNAGDSLIYQGERAYLRRLGVRVDYITSEARYDANQLRRRVPDGKIVIHGGGNLGDRYPRHQAVREQVLRDFPDRKILQLPQSIEFQDPSDRERVRREFARHRDFTLLLRETPSFEAGRTLFGDDNAVEYCPDAAFGVGRLKASRRPDNAVVALLRTDGESVQRDYSFLAQPDYLATDWTMPRPRQRAWRATEFPLRAAKRLPAAAAHAVSHLTYIAQADLNVRAAVWLLSRGRGVFTDRLHAAVMGALMGLPVVAMDNIYGKVSAVYSDYLHHFDNVTFAKSADEARSWLEAKFP